VKTIPASNNLFSKKIKGQAKSVEAKRDCFSTTVSSY
jgi:hypothetical protein